MKQERMKSSALPPGQISRETFPRFGLSQYANRFPTSTDTIDIQVGGDLEEHVIKEAFHSLPRVKQTSDFHCVTTWSVQDLKWEGVRFSDFYESIIQKQNLKPNAHSFVIFKAQDGYKTGLMLEDLLQENVLLADTLNGQPVSIAHGAPLRLVVPSHYGYKNLKHIYRIEFHQKTQKVKQGILSFMDHPRARVAHEERAKGGPGWFFRYLYRPLIKSTVKEFEKALAEYESLKGS